MNHILYMTNHKKKDSNSKLISHQTNKKILVGKPTLPDLDKVIPHLKNIWESKFVTNNGPYLKKFESRLEQYLGVKSVITFCNATSALISLLKCLELKGKVITTPFSFVATANVIHLSGLKPQFIDIDETTYNLDPKNLKNKSFKNISAIMPVHTFSKPAFVDEFKKIGRKEKVKVIYDGSHGFGAKYKNKSVLSYGDASVVSFHATKLLSTLEGGAVVTNNLTLAKKLKLFRNFGFNQSGEANLIGLNGKLNEMQALIGLLQLDNIEVILSKRKKLANYYSKKLGKISYLDLPKYLKNHDDNHSYFPVEVNKVNGNNREKVFKLLEMNNIICKRYFYPIITNQPIFKKHLNKNQCFRNAENLSKKILCLPIYPEMSLKDIDYILKILKSIEN